MRIDSLLTWGRWPISATEIQVCDKPPNPLYIQASPLLAPRQRVPTRRPSHALAVLDAQAASRRLKPGLSFVIGWRSAPRIPLPDDDLAITDLRSVASFYADRPFQPLSQREYVMQTRTKKHRSILCSPGSSTPTPKTIPSSRTHAPDRSPESNRPPPNHRSIL